MTSLRAAGIPRILQILAVLVAVGGLVALRARADEREGRRSPEAERGPRRAAEGEGRRSPEAEAGPRRPAEREGRRPAEGAGRRGGDAERALGNFRPQTVRERALYQMLLQLQREVQTLRQEVRTLRGDGGEGRGRDLGREGGREGADRDRGGEIGREVSAAPAGWERTKAGGVFRTYDKNGDQSVSLEEWLAITNGNVNDARRRLQTERFREAGAGADNALSPAEFVRWWNGREGARPPRRDGEGGRRGESRER